MKSIVFVALLVLSLSRAAVAQEPPTAPANTGAAKAGSATAEKSGAEKYFTDIELVNQNGEKVRFYPDLLQGKTVIINSFFATCQGSCLPITRNLEKIQEALGDRLGKEPIDATRDPRQADLHAGHEPVRQTDPHLHRSSLEVPATRWLAPTVMQRAARASPKAAYVVRVV